MLTDRTRKIVENALGRALDAAEDAGYATLAALPPEVIASAKKIRAASNSATVSAYLQHVVPSASLDDVRELMDELSQENTPQLTEEDQAADRRRDRQEEAMMQRPPLSPEDQALLDDNDIDELLASQPPPPTMPPPPQPLERPPGDRSDNYLREIEAIAVEVDELESTVSDEESRGRLSARRQRLLIELDVAGVLDESSQLGPRLRALQLTKLVGYSDAAAALWRYYNSAGRARFVKTPKPAKLLDGDISLDWFRVPSGYVPEGDGITPESWLGLCEANFAFDRPKRGGQSWLRLERRVHRMEYRGELTNTPKLVRVVPG